MFAQSRNIVDIAVYWCNFFYLKDWNKAAESEAVKAGESFSVQYIVEVSDAADLPVINLHWY